MQILKKAGWFEERRIDIEDILKLLVERKFEIFLAVKEFFAEFAMLEIAVPNPHAKEIIQKYNFRKYDLHHTNVFKALGDAGDYYCTTPFEEFAKEKMIIVGKISNGNMWLMV
ncbi:SUKH-3 domain-containing protein [Acetivibrio clariflavus]|uniref:SUKH-3 domain-containing protein n=1 Tax=Acetivibrio clariflavus TaxID=288965 RepID=UPI00030F204A|nr:SUKH-3 domain-containing protein [Acetivibrio clariflavus]